jgi:hypothetical protein
MSLDDLVDLGRVRAAAERLHQRCFQLEAGSVGDVTGLTQGRIGRGVDAFEKRLETVHVQIDLVEHGFGFRRVVRRAPPSRVE